MNPPAVPCTEFPEVTPFGARFDDHADGAPLQPASSAVAANQDEYRLMYEKTILFETLLMKPLPCLRIKVLQVPERTVSFHEKVFQVPRIAYL